MNETNGNENYIDYNELSEEKKKALYEEFLASYAEEKRLSRIFRFAPLAFAAVIMILAVASLVVYFAAGIGVTVIAALAAPPAAPLLFVVFKIRLGKKSLPPSPPSAPRVGGGKKILAGTR